MGERFVHLFKHAVHSKPGSSATNTLLAEDGATRPVEMQSSLVKWGTQPVRQAILRDITERLTMAHERRIASEAMASVAEGIIIADAGRRVISVNAAHTELTGFTAWKSRACRFDDDTCAARRHAAAGRYGNEVARTDTLERRSADAPHATAACIPEKLSISAIRGCGRRRADYVAVCTDITTTRSISATWNIWHGTMR